LKLREKTNCVLWYNCANKTTAASLINAQCSQVLELALDLVPSLRRLLALQIGSLPFSVSLTLTLGIIGLGWLLFRPLLGLALLLLATAPYIVPFYRLLMDRRRVVNRP